MKAEGCYNPPVSPQLTGINWALDPNGHKLPNSQIKIHNSPLAMEEQDSSNLNGVNNEDNNVPESLQNDNVNIIADQIESNSNTQDNITETSKEIVETANGEVESQTLPSQQNELNSSEVPDEQSTNKAEHTGTTDKQQLAEVEGSQSSETKDEDKPAEESRSEEKSETTQQSDNGGIISIEDLNDPRSK
jgi:hypothetical protein